MLRLEVERIAKGGEGVARHPDGRVVFVRGALPGDVVDAEVVEDKKRMLRAVTRTVVSAGAGRVTPPCPHVADGCGGCDLQHASLLHQRELKLAIVGDVLERIAHLDAEVSWGGSVSTDGYRTSVRCAVTGGKAGFRLARSHDRVATPNCAVVHPAVRAVMEDTYFGAADEVFIRVGAATGDRNVVVSPQVMPDARGDAVADAVGARDGARSKLYIEEMVAGHTLRVSAGSFFQSGPQAAELLVSTVGRALGELSAEDTVVDLYAGVGLFSVTLGHQGRTIAVESSGSAVHDARHNLEALNRPGQSVEVVRAPVERWQPEPADVVIADPPRSGLDKAAVSVVAGTGATTVVLVSCDPAAFARDARLLTDAGYALAEVCALDLFPQTSHVEVVARFESA